MVANVSTLLFLICALSSAETLARPRRQLRHPLRITALQPTASLLATAKPTSPNGVAAPILAIAGRQRLGNLEKKSQITTGESKSSPSSGMACPPFCTEYRMTTGVPSFTQVMLVFAVGFS